MQNTIRLLGAVEVEIASSAGPADRSAPPGVYRPRKLALLSYMLLSRRPVRRLELAALLWPDAVEKRARGSLNQLMVEMRRELGAESFAARSDDELVLTGDAFSCDALDLLNAAAAGRHEDAIALYRGPLMDGFAVSGLDEYNDWLDRARMRIGETVADSAWRVACSTSDASLAAHALRLAASLRPHDEAILRKRMSIAAETSGAADAGAMYETHRARIAEELGITPSLETRKLLYSLCTVQDADEPAPPIVTTHADTVGAFPSRSHSGRRWSFAAAAACIMLVGMGIFASIHATRERADSSRNVNVVLMNFGNQDVPAIRALPGLVATYLIRDSAIDVAYNDTVSSAYQVVANLQSENDELFGTVQIRNGGSVISATTLRTSMSLGIDTIAAQLARYVENVTSPLERYDTPTLAVNAARQHLLYARADYARGVRQNASFELEKARLQLDSVSTASRDTTWNTVAAAIAREQEWQRRGE